MDRQNSVAAFNATSPNSASLPYTVRYKGWRLAWRLIGYGGLLIVLGFGAYSVARGSRSPSSPLLFYFWLMGIGFCLLQLWRLRMPEAVFYVDRVEKPGLFRQSVLHRANMKGVGRVIRTRYGSYFELVSGSPSEPSIRLDGAVRRNPVVADWLRGATDPKAEAIKADRALVISDGRYGATETERVNRLDLAKRLVLGFNVACLALAAWLGFVSGLNPASLSLAALSLGIGALMVFKSDGLVIWYDRNSARPAVVGSFAPAVALTARAGLTTHLLQHDGLISLAAVVGVGAGMFGYSRLTTSSTRLGSAFSLSVVGALAVYGLSVALDVGLDRSPSKTFVATVTDAHVSRGRSTTYYLDLTPWSHQPASEVAVSSSLYDSAPVGSNVCISSRSGALELAWFDVALCPLGHDSGLAQPAARPPPGVTNPDWISTPTGQDLADLYPERAQRLGRTGAVTIRCLVQVTGTLADCRIIEETPSGFGFGAATLEAAGRFRMRPRTVNGQPVAGGEVTIPMRWQLG